MEIRGLIYDSLRRQCSPRVRALLKRQPWFFPILQRLVGDSAYSADYYADIERLELASVPYIARWIATELRPRNAIDIGCGPGHLMAELVNNGIEVIGVDISENAGRLVRKRGLPFYKVDLTNCNRIHPGRFALAISCEVAEHLEPQHAKTFVRRLTEMSDIVYLTAAEPNIGIGLYHFNEQPNDYWIALFKEDGFFFDHELTAAARSYMDLHKVISYLAKPMIFRAGPGR